jgi:hypothetical protein
VAAALRLQNSRRTGRSADPVALATPLAARSVPFAEPVKQDRRSDLETKVIDSDPSDGGRLPTVVAQAWPSPSHTQEHRASASPTGNWLRVADLEDRVKSGVASPDEAFH